MAKVFIIAEAGVNHNGSMKTAKHLIDMAKEAGCDAIKFQSFKAEKLVTPHAPKAGYQTANLGKSISQYEMLKGLELSEADHEELVKYCKRTGIIFMSTAFDEESADLLYRLGMKIFKIPSGELTNKPLVEHIARKGRDIILSTGMSYLYEVDQAIAWIRKIWKRLSRKPKLTLLHCTSNYPTSPEDANLLAMNTLESAFGLTIGYSDNTIGTEVPIAAVAMGAKVIEKHFTLNRKMHGPDHKASIEPAGMSELVRAIRNVEKARGSAIKRPAVCEKDTIRTVRRSLVASRDIKAGEKMSGPNIAVKRPGAGISPVLIDRVIGMTASRDISKDAVLKMSFFHQADSGKKRGK